MFWEKIEKTVTMHELPPFMLADIEFDLRRVISNHRSALGLTDRPFTAIVTKCTLHITQRTGGEPGRNIYNRNEDNIAPLLREPTARKHVTLPKLPHRLVREMNKSLKPLTNKYIGKLGLTDKPFTVTYVVCNLTIIQETDHAI